MRSLAKIMLDLRWAFPHSKVEAEALHVYAERLNDIPLPVLEAAVEKMIDTETFFPTLAAIRKAAAEAMADIPTEDQALALIDDILVWGRIPEETRGPRPPIHPIVKQALDHVGGFYAFKTTDEPSVIRGQFLRLFRELRGRDVLALQVRRDTAALDREPTRVSRPPTRPELTVS